MPRTASAPRAADRLLEAASDLFYAQGVRAVGIEEIVDKAGVTKPSLYRNYDSKDALTLAVLRRNADRFWARLGEAEAAHPNDARAALLAFFAGMAERSTREDYRGCSLTNAGVEYPDPTHPIHAEVLTFKTAQRKRFRALAKAAGAADPPALADGLLLLLEGIYVNRQLHGPRGPARAAAGAAAALIAAGCGG